MQRREYKSGTRWCAFRWKDIYWQGSLYLKRLHIFQCPWFSVLLHFIVDKDRQRHMHDHPVDMFCIVLKGQYLEDNWIEPNGRDEMVINHVKWFNWIPCHKIHRIGHITKGGVITLCFAGPRKRNWGFWTEEGWIDWKTYHKLYEGETS